MRARHSHVMTKPSDCSLQKRDPETNTRSVSLRSCDGWARVLCMFISSAGVYTVRVQRD